MCPGIFGYRGTLLYIPCDVISITCELGVVFRVNEISRSRPIHCSVPCIFMCTFISGWYKIRRTYRVWTFSWRLDGRIIVCPVPGSGGAWWTCIPPRRWPRPGWSSAWDTRPGSARDAGRQRIPGMPAIWPGPSSRRRRGGRGDRTGAGRHAVEAGRRTVRRGRRCGQCQRISRSVFMIPPWRFGAVRSAVGLIVVSIAAVG